MLKRFFSLVQIFALIQMQIDSVESYVIFQPLEKYIQHNSHYAVPVEHTVEPR